MTVRVRRPARSRFGASLAEGMIAMLISCMFLSVLPGFYLTSIKIWQRETSELEAAGTADFALTRMEEDVRNARSVAVSADGEQVTLTLPLRAYHPGLGREVNVTDSNGWLVDGDCVQYYYAEAGYGTEDYEGSLYRRVIHADSSTSAPRLVAAHVQPDLNPLDATGNTTPLFSFDAGTRTLTVTVSAAEPKPSSGTFAPNQTVVLCTRDDAPLVRVATEAHPEGEIRCSECDAEVSTSAEIAVCSTKLLLRNQ
jgi:hypothetical protein